jgi:hypothetical protein
MKKNVDEEQMRVIFLILILAMLAAMRSQTVKGYFANGWAGLGTSLSNSAQGKAPTGGKTPAETLQWHQLLWWGGGSVLLIVLADPFPNLITWFLLLVILEEVLVHWKDYQPYITPPKK